MTFKCCICGKIYNNEAAAVKCVNRCGRAMHQKGIFETKESKYSGETTETQVLYEAEELDLEFECSKKISELKDKVSPSIYNGFIKEFEKWETLTDAQRQMFYDLIFLY